MPLSAPLSATIHRSVWRQVWWSLKALVGYPNLPGRYDDSEHIKLVYEIGGSVLSCTNVLPLTLADANCRRRRWFLPVDGVRFRMASREWGAVLWSNDR